MCRPATINCTSDCLGFRDFITRFTRSKASVHHTSALAATAVAALLAATAVSAAEVLPSQQGTNTSHVMCACYLRHPSGQIRRFLCSSRQSLVVVRMGPDKPSITHRPVATVPDNQLEQAVSAMEVLGNLQHPTCQQQAPDFTFTGMPAGWTGWRGAFHTAHYLGGEVLTLDLHNSNCRKT